MDSNAKDIKRTLAIRIAIIAGVFSLIVAAMLLVNYSQRMETEPGLEKQLANRKDIYREFPGTEKFAGEVRQLDLKIRQGRMRWLAFSRKGAVLLLCGLVVCIGCLKYASSLGGVKPVVEGDAVDGAGQEKIAVMSGRFVWAGIAFLLLFAVLIGVRPGVEYVAEDLWPEFISGWPTFRGPHGSGVSQHENVPMEFDVKSGTGVLWKSPVPMDGMNSPVLWGDRVFLSGGDEKKLQVFCYDANTGQLVWSRDVKSLAPADAEIEPMEDTGFSAPTMAVDGKRVYAIFATGDVVAYDFDGNLVWSKYLGVPDNMYGFSASLAMYKKMLIIQYDNGDDEDGKSKLYALDGFSGQPVWQVTRAVYSSWSSPVVVDVGLMSQIVTLAKPFAISYDAESGVEIWRAEFEAEDIAPIPVYAGGMVFAVMPNDLVMAIRADGQGDVTKTHVAWENDEVDAPDICSPVTNGELLFVLSTDGSLTCMNVKDGKMVWNKDLDEMFQASPSIVGGKLVLLSEKGNLVVAEVGREYKEISRSKLGERCYASPAFADGRMYIRSKKNLYCISKKE